MEEFSANCGFILTCNFLNRIIAPLHSRCSVIQFKINTKDKPKLASQFMKRVIGILETEKVEFDQKVVAEVIMKYFPDWRRVINELQRYSATGKIDAGLLSNLTEDNTKSLIKMLKEKDFTGMRKWVNDNLDNEPNVLFRRIFDGCHEYLSTKSVPQMVILLGEYQYKSAFVVDQEINFVSFLTEVMADCEFK
jgi:DNA polymerase III delta prime subunit